MLFNSFAFLAAFTILVTLYYLIPHKFRWPYLLAASFGFYATFQPRYLLALLAATLIAYLAGLGLGGASRQGVRKAILAAGLLFELGALLLLKYYGLFASSLEAVVPPAWLGGEALALPRLGLVAVAGLSFFSFSCASYVVDVYRGKMAAERHIGRFALYVAFFPKLLAGPIERATTFLPQLTRVIRFDPDQVSQGLQWILWGLFKKVVIADRLAAFVDTAYARPGLSSPADLLIATYFFAFQIYCDFSGYTDIAIGLAKVLGFDLMENFRRPYFAKSTPEFWSERWHISLARWFRDYLYIPLGGSRVPVLRHYFNLFAVFAVSGLWHGANWTFAVWGALNGAYVLLDRLSVGLRARIGRTLRIPGFVTGILGRLITFHLVLVAWVFFRAASIQDAWTVFTRIAKSISMLPRILKLRLSSEEMIISLVLIGVLLLIEALDEWGAFWKVLRVKPVYLRWAVYYLLLIALVVFGTWQMREFVYMQF